VGARPAAAISFLFNSVRLVSLLRMPADCLDLGGREGLLEGDGGGRFDGRAREWGGRQVGKQFLQLGVMLGLGNQLIPPGYQAQLQAAVLLN
jgi:hypothetical protein